MPLYTTPEMVEVDYPPRDTNDDAPMLTYLFRNSSCLPEAFYLSMAAAHDKENFTLYSAACSNGAELYSVLAIAGPEPENRISAVGFDINESAIKSAKAGVFAVRRTLTPGSSDIETEEFEQASDTLAKAGFELRQANHVPALGHTSMRYLVADGSDLRRTHNVRFLRHDLRKPLPASRSADLILANNLLVHMEIKDAVDILDNLADALADTGVLSFGEAGLEVLDYDTERPYEGHYSSIVKNYLQRHYGLTPLFTKKGGQPIMYARQATFDALAIDQPISLLQHARL